MFEWNNTIIGDIAEVKGGKRLPKGMDLEPENNGAPYIRITDWLDGTIDTRNLMYVPEIAQPIINRYRINSDDVFISIVGTIGRIALLGNDLDGAFLTENAAKISVTDPKMNPSFLRYALISSGGQDEIMSRTVGSTQPKLALHRIRDIVVPCPPRKTQDAISEVLGALDDKIAANNKIARTIEALGSAKFKRLGLDVEPSHEVVLLGDVFDLNPRRTVASASPTVIDMQALPTAEPLVERWTTGIRKGGARFANGDTLIARITPCLENRKTAFVDFLKDGDVGIGSTEFIVMRSKNDLPLGLSYFMAVSERFRDFAIQNLVGTSGRQRVAASDLARHTLCPVAPSALRTFGEWADANLKVLGSLRGENRTLATTRDTLLPQLISGKLRIDAAEELVAATI